jgi:hypothetical protein
MNTGNTNYSIEVAGDGTITIILGPDTGLSQDFLLALISEVQNQRSEHLSRRQAEALAAEASKPRWWPPEFTCKHCGLATAIATEPDSYIVLCPECGEVVVELCLDQQAKRCCTGIVSNLGDGYESCPFCD